MTVSMSADANCSAFNPRLASVGPSVAASFRPSCSAFPATSDKALASEIRDSARAPVKRRLMVKVRPSTYRLTVLGRDRVKELKKQRSR